MNSLLLFPILLLISTFLILNTTIIYQLAIRQLRASALENVSVTVEQTTRLLEVSLKDVTNTFYQLDRANSSSLDFCAIVPSPTTYYSNYLGEMGRSIQESFFEHYDILDSAVLYIDRDNLLIYQSDQPPVRYSINLDAWESYKDTPAGWHILQPHQHIIESDSSRGLALSILHIYQSRYDNITSFLQFSVKLSYIRQIVEGADWGEGSGMLLTDGEAMVSFDKTGEDIIARTDIGERLSKAPTSGNFSLSGNNTQYLVIHDTLSMGGWRLVSYISEETLARRATAITSVSLLLLLLLLGGAALFIPLVVRMVSSPIMGITRKIQGIGENDLDLDINYKGIVKEAHYLADALVFLVRHSQNLLERVRVQQELKRQAEFTAMQAQIQPHFLYNSLYTIHQLCAIDSERAAKMVLALSDFYRIGVNSPSCELPLEQEFSIARSYLELNRIRYGELLSYRINLAEELKSYSILRTALQPLIENCIKHAIDDRSSPLEIVLSASLDQNTLVITVEDNGCGISPRRLERLRTRLARPVDSDNAAEAAGLPEGYSSSGVGMYNVHRRLQMFYGSGSGLSIESGPECGTTVTVRLPAVHAQQPPAFDRPNSSALM